MHGCFVFFVFLLAFQVTVEDPKTGDAVDFPCRRWFSKSEDDGQISRELIRADGKDGDMVTDKGECTKCTLCHVHVLVEERWQTINFDLSVIMLKLHTSACKGPYLYLYMLFPQIG